MLRAAAIECLPWLGVMIAAAIGLRLLMWACGSGADFRRLRNLHRDQSGGAQSLSFVLATPVFIMLMMLIVQVSQVMIGVINAHQAAFATARSASVWIGAELEEDYTPDENRENYVPTLGSVYYQDGHPVRELSSGTKFEKIQQAAWIAMMPAAPSNNPNGDARADAVSDALVRAYQSLAPKHSGGRVPARVINKFAYSRDHTQIRVRLTGPEDELEFYVIQVWDEARSRFVPQWIPVLDMPDRVGWRDQVTVDLRHDFALLPGPARLLARKASANDAVAPSITKQGSFSTITLTATATLGIEGQRSLHAYSHPIH